MGLIIIILSQKTGIIIFQSCKALNKHNNHGGGIEIRENHHHGGVYSHLGEQPLIADKHSTYVKNRSNYIPEPQIKALEKTNNYRGGIEI